MAWKFTSPLANLYIKRFVIDGFSATWSCTIFPGTTPTTTADVSSNWSTYKTTFLVHWTGLSWIHPNANIFNRGNQCVASIPAAATAASGAPTTATWGILWTTGITQLQLANASIPSGQYVVVDVTDNTGNGVIRLADTSITSGQTYQPELICLRLNLV